MHVIEQAVVGQSGDEDARRAHRPDGMRAGWADTDREQVEHADGHSTIVRRKARASETHGDQPPDGTANGPTNTVTE
jgi:hypothetical protein